MTVTWPVLPVCVMVCVVDGCFSFVVRLLQSMAVFVGTVISVR